MRAPGASDLAELRRLTTRYGLPLEVIDRISLRPFEVARAIGVSPRKVTEWIASGRLPALKPDGVVLVALQDLLAFLESHPYVPRQPARPLPERARAFLSSPRRRASRSTA